MSDTEQTPVTETKEVEYTEIEQVAMEQGWKPKDEYEGDANWVPAEIWVARTPLFEKIEQQKSQHKREINEVKEAFKTLKESFDQRVKGEYDRALKDLQARKREAIKEGDLEYAADLEDQIDAHKESAPKPAEAFEPAQQNAAVINAWRGKNDWYERDQEKTEIFDGFFMSKFSKTKDLEASLEYADKMMDKVSKPKETTAVEKVSDGGTPGKRVKPKESKVELTEEEERAMKTFVRSGIMTEEEYIKQIKAFNQGAK